MAEALLELGAILLGLAVLARLADRVGIPTVSLYLVAGLAFGKGGIFPVVTTHDFIQLGSEIGLVLMLFMLGLEYSASELITTLKTTGRAGVVDLLTNFVPGLVCGFILGWGVIPALFLGAITYVSSSGIIARSLSETGRATSHEARFVVSIAIMEDLAMAVMLPVLASLAVGGISFKGLAYSLLAVLGVIVFILTARRVDVGLSKVIFSKSDEALLLTILGIAVAIAGVAELVQISAAVGALLAGIALSGPAAHGARGLLKPLRDLFAALFFLFIGFSVDPGKLGSTVVPALLLAAAGVASKLITARIGGKMSGLGRTASTDAGWLLVPRGEFSIAIGAVAVVTGLQPRLAGLAVTYVLMLAIVGSVGARIRVQRTTSEAAD
jgi:CPA2 family monovalent cation:H+ antiporter-2